WYFVVISDRQTLSEIPKHHEYSGMLRQASCAIAVCGDLELDDGRGFWVQDCSAATENTLLAAHANGLGAVWLGVYPIERRVAGIKSLLGLPENIVPLSLVSLGYPAERRLHTNRYDAARVRYDHW
ncbi:MAG: nitroreductase family protein, partial [Dehalococcoidales bacterium]|nr:nitroreductase family protein [Dehalococcoidales bacterium]